MRIVADSTSTKKRQGLKREKPNPPPLPNPQSYQQTIQRPFTIGGVGLHTGQYSFVCVRPALAGEGRYFVRVPPGTNADDYRLETPTIRHHSELDFEKGADIGVDEDDRGQLFLQFLEAVDKKKFKGNFGDYIKEVYGDPNDTFLMDVIAIQAPEEAKPRDPSQPYILASIASAECYRVAATLLQGSEYAVLSPEALLAALEACGVDNARIEIEGGADEEGADEEGAAIDINGGLILEVPVVDGSALGWALEIQKSGLREATPSLSSTPDDTSSPMLRTAPAPQEMITVRDGDSFISFYPHPLTPKITAGVDQSKESPLVGRQWFTWSPTDSEPSSNYTNHFRWEVAPARHVIPSIRAAENMFADGLLRAGPDYCCLVGAGEDWFDPMLLRFPDDEAARKAAANMMGNLALAGKNGGRGLPQGHVVAYNAGTELQLQFVKAMAVKAREWAYAPVEI